MKTKSVILVALMAISASVLASTEPVDSKVVVLNQKPGIFKVIYQGTGAVTMTITDNDGDILFKEETNTAHGFIRPVNFSGMHSGLYSIKITDQNGEQIQTVDYNSDLAKRNVSIGRFGEDGKYLMAVANAEGQEINVKIYDGQDNLVYTEKRTIDGNFALVYNVQKVSGTPTFFVTDNAGNDLVIKK